MVNAKEPEIITQFTPPDVFPFYLSRINADADADADVNDASKR